MSISRAESNVLNQLTPVWSKPTCPHCSRRLEFKMNVSDDNCFYVILSRCRECISLFVADWGDYDSQSRLDRMSVESMRLDIDIESPEGSAWADAYMEKLAVEDAAKKQATKEAEDDDMPF